MAKDKSKPIDPVNLQQTSKYIKNGLTVVSNNTDIVPRDENGNIIVQDGSYMIIETNSFNINNNTMLKVLDTQFNYFKFPAQIIEVQDEDLNLDLNFETDNISANLIIPTPLDSNQQPQNIQKISTIFESDWYYGENAPDSSGYRELPFVGGTQPNANGYTITKEILDSLKQQNKTIRFKFAVQYRSTIDQRTGIATRLVRSNRKIYNPLDLKFRKEQNANEQRTGVGAPGDEINPYGFTVRDYESDYPYLVVTYIVDLDDTKAGDVYKLLAASDSKSVILAQNSYWDIDVVDIPNPDNEIYRNIYSINEDTVVQNENNEVVVKKSQDTNQIAILQ